VDMLRLICPNTGDRYEAHEPRIVTLVPAPPGTRALYLNGQSDQGYFLEHVVAWGLYECAACEAQWTRALVQATEGNADGLVVAIGWGNFWRVLDPTEPLPSPEHAWAEIDRRERETRLQAAADELETAFALPTVSEDERAANRRPAPDPTGQRAYDAVKLAQTWPSWRDDYDFGVAAEAALAKARRSPTASLKALAMTARYAAEQAAQT
jgi:hypothetical protein